MSLKNTESKGSREDELMARLAKALEKDIDDASMESLLTKLRLGDKEVIGEIMVASESLIYKVMLNQRESRFPLDIRFSYAFEALKDFALKKVGQHSEFRYQRFGAWVIRQSLLDLEINGAGLIKMKPLESIIDVMLKDVAFSLLLIRCRLGEYKSNLLLLKDFGQLKRVNEFQEQLSGLLKEFDLDIIDLKSEKVLRQSTISELENQLSTLKLIKEKMVISEAYHYVAKIKNIESGILALIQLIR
ncbi:hypothetical protein [Pedobacter aquatilis]|uniref:hypothetical protein n=1 Tax=Pedobacter aquatilis TaxID=351343 RepID=UPI00292FEDA4|nr:hypothetical protein [Pedobacter aquatilis]